MTVEKTKMIAELSVGGSVALDLSLQLGALVAMSVALLLELFTKRAHISHDGIELRLRVSLLREVLQLQVVALALEVQQLLLEDVAARALGCQDLCELVLEAAGAPLAFTLRC